MNIARLLLKGVRDLPKVDYIGTCDAYLVASLGSQKYKTKVIWNQYEGNWNEGCDFEFGADDSTLLIEVFDKDMIGSQFIGSTQLNLRDLLLDPESLDPFTVVEKELDIFDKDDTIVKGHSGSKTTIILSAYLIGVVTPTSVISRRALEEKVCLSVTLKEVAHLPKMDMIGSCDAYAVACSGGREVMCASFGCIMPSAFLPRLAPRHPSRPLRLLTRVLHRSCTTTSSSHRLPICLHLIPAAMTHI
jgi:hypothetical protein